MARAKVNVHDALSDAIKTGASCKCKQSRDLQHIVLSSAEETLRKRYIKGLLPSRYEETVERLCDEFSFNDTNKCNLLQDGHRMSSKQEVVTVNQTNTSSKKHTHVFGYFVSCHRNDNMYDVAYAIYRCDYETTVPIVNETLEDYYRHKAMENLSGTIFK